MNEITLLREHGPAAPPLEPPVLHAARAALPTDMERSTTVRGRIRRLPGRRRRRQLLLALTTAAAAWTAPVVIAAPDPVAPPAAGMTLVAMEELTFPLSLDPVPAGMTPTFTGGEGWASEGDIAGYTSADGTGFTIYLQPEKPTWVADGYENYDITATGTTTVGGVEAQYVQGSMGRMCTIVNSCFEDLAFADLVWERQPGQWVYLRGDNAYGNLDAVVAVGESLVDRPQPVTLQVGLAPAGWSVDSWHSSTDLTLVNDADPDQALGVQVQPAPGYDKPVDQRIESVTAIAPVISTTVRGRPAQLVHAHDYMDVDLRFWLLAWQLPDGALVTVTAPEEFTQDGVLAIAAQVTYTP